MQSNKEEASEEHEGMNKRYERGHPSEPAVLGQGARRPRCTGYRDQECSQGPWWLTLSQAAPLLEFVWLTWLCG